MVTESLPCQNFQKMIQNIQKFRTQTDTDPDGTGYMTENDTNRSVWVLFWQQTKDDGSPMMVGLKFQIVIIAIDCCQVFPKDAEMAKWSV